MKNIIIKLDTKQAVKNEMYKTLDTKESKKCIKREKKINIEKIFIKKTLKNKNALKTKNKK